MKEDYQMTRQEAEKEMEYYRKIFSVVRLLGEEDMKALEKGCLTGTVPDCCQCYKFWKKDILCENCISLKVWKEKTERTKLEFQEDDIYQVISRYVEIDGKPYVMELVKKMYEDSLLDADGRRKRAYSLSNVKLKTD